MEQKREGAAGRFEADVGRRMPADVAAGMQLFAEIKNRFDAEMEDCCKRNGNPRDLALAFLSGFGAFIVANAGFNAARHLHEEALQILKKVGH